MNAQLFATVLFVGIFSVPPILSEVNNDIHQLKPNKPLPPIPNASEDDSEKLLIKKLVNTVQKASKSNQTARRNILKILSLMSLSHDDDYESSSLESLAALLGKSEKTFSLSPSLLNTAEELIGTLLKTTIEKSELEISLNQARQEVIDARNALQIQNNIIKGAKDMLYWKDREYKPSEIRFPNDRLFKNVIRIPKSEIYKAFAKTLIALETLRQIEENPDSRVYLVNTEAIVDEEKQNSWLHKLVSKDIMIVLEDEMKLLEYPNVNRKELKKLSDEIMKTEQLFGNEKETTISNLIANFCEDRNIPFIPSPTNNRQLSNLTKQLITIDSL